MTQRQSAFIPNSYQTPNLYVDAYLYLLTDEEWKVLSYAIRRTLGFNKRRDRISLSQFANGITDKAGKHLDYGCGLSVDTVRKVVTSLCLFGFLTKTAENDPTKNNGPEYELQLEDSQIKTSLLLERQGKKKKDGKARTKKAIRFSKAKRLQYPLVSDTTTPLVSDTTTPPSVGHQHNNQETQRNTDSLAERVRKMSIQEISDLPEIKLFEKVTSRFPGQYQWVQIVETIQEHKITEEAMRKCWKVWSSEKGYRPANLGWLVDWCINGIPELKKNGHKGNRHKAVTPKSKYTEAELEFAREEAKKIFLGDKA